MSKVRVYEVARQLNLDPKSVVALFQQVGVSEVRNHMSSVEPEAIERVKRHLEKQNTHDVVEERIRPTVVKRRTVAKRKKAEPTAEAARPEPAASAPAPASKNGKAAAAPSEPAPVAPPSAPASRKAVAKAPPSSKAAVDVAPEPPTPPASEKAVVAAPPAPKSSKKAVAKAAEPVVEPEAAEVADAAPAAAPPASAAEPQADEELAAAPEEEEGAPDSEGGSVGGTRRTGGPPPKTGVEYWTGRPGVPMPTPPSAMRTGIGGGQTGAMARRVQYDPRAGAASQARSGGRPIGTHGRGFMGRGPGRRMFGQPMRKGPGQVSTKEMADHKKVIRIEENITLQSMAQKMSLKATELLMKLIGMGMTGIHINTTLDADTAKILASDFGWEIEDVAKTEDEIIAAARGESAAAEEVATIEGTTRPAVVTVMGHVDHGKTSLLDKIRKASVASGEAGGITQHIGAYKVHTPHGDLVFLDTPGHEAFTAMRARGAGVTDIVVLVVAADDGVMPQTREAVAHAKAANVPIIVAVNKIDKEDADPERVKRELVELELQPEDWGGDTIYANVSALTGEGLEHLLEVVALQSEMLGLKADATAPASGTVVEALLDRGRGPVARILVQDGTLKVGDFLLAGPGFGKVRAMTDEHGRQIKEAGPSTPVEVLGLSEVPGAGDPVHAVKDPKKAQQIAEQRKGKMAKSLIPSTSKVTLEDLSKRMADADQLELRVIIKGDVQGSVEALGEALAKLTSPKVRLSIVHAAVGGVTEGDVNLGIAARAIILAFNVRPTGNARSLADENGIEIRQYSIIYNVVDDVRGAMEGLLPPTITENQIGEAEVRAIFKIKGTVVAGSYVLDGQIKRNGFARIIREDEVLWEGKIAALKRFKEDVKDVASGFECGISFDGFTELKEGDRVRCYEITETKQVL